MEDGHDTLIIDTYMKTSERGEVATILAISAIVVIGISMISSAFLGGKKQSTSSKASDVCKFTRGLTCDDIACDGTCTDSRAGATCCTQVAVYDSPTPIPNTGHGPIPDDGIPTDAPPTNAPVNTPTTAPLPTQPTTDPVGSGGQPTTAPPANTSSGLCGGNNAACTSNCGSGNDCVKYLKSVTVPGLSDGSVINTDTFDCDIVTTNVEGARTDRDNICGVKVNDQWPAWCPWDGVLQDMCGATITSRANCNLKSSHFNNTPVKAGDKLQVVAARKVGSCGNIPWNTGGSFITGPTFYYKQKSGGAGGTAPPTTNNPPAGTQPTVAPKTPAPDLGDPTKCPDANNARTIAENYETTDGKYKCCGAKKNPKDPSLNYASWSDNPNPKCLGGGSTTVPTTPPAASGNCTTYNDIETCFLYCAMKIPLGGYSCGTGLTANICCPKSASTNPTGTISTPIPTLSLTPVPLVTWDPRVTPTLVPTGRTTIQPTAPTAIGITSPTVTSTQFCPNPNIPPFNGNLNFGVYNERGDGFSLDLASFMNESIDEGVRKSLRTAKSLDEIRNILVDKMYTAGFAHNMSAILTDIANRIDSSGLNYIKVNISGYTVNTNFLLQVKGKIETVVVNAKMSEEYGLNLNRVITKYVDSFINDVCK